jgi:hypothetical protein
VALQATSGAAVDVQLRVHDWVEQNTRKSYETHARLYIKLTLGDVPICKIKAQLPEDSASGTSRSRRWRPSRGVNDAATKVLRW